MTTMATNEATISEADATKLVSKPEVDDPTFGDLPDNFGESDPEFVEPAPAAPEPEEADETPEPAEDPAPAEEPAPDPDPEPETDLRLENERLKAQLEVYRSLGKKEETPEPQLEAPPPPTETEVDDLDKLLDEEFITDEEYNEAFSDRRAMNRLLNKVAVRAARMGAARAEERMTRKVVPLVTAHQQQMQSIQRDVDGFLKANADLDKPELKAEVYAVANGLAAKPEYANAPLSKLLTDAAKHVRKIIAAGGGQSTPAPKPAFAGVQKGGPNPRSAAPAPKLSALDKEMAEMR
jgi:hypothetical protein